MASALHHPDPADGTTGAEEPPARARYVGPHDGGHPDGRSRRRPPGMSLDASYQTQTLVWRAHGRRVVLQPSPDFEGTGEAHPWGRTVVLLTAWNAHGEARTLEQNRVAQTELRQHTGSAGGTVLATVTATPPGRGWVEEMLVVDGLSDALAVEMARDAGQAAVIRWDTGELAVIPTGIVGPVTATGRPWSLQASPETCPMRLDDRPDAMCVVHGGPWTSGAIHAAALWQTHRALLAPALGCGVCADGSGPVRGPGGGRGAIIIGSIGLGSRHGGYVWSP